MPAVATKDMPRRRRSEVQVGFAAAMRSTPLDGSRSMRDQVYRIIRQAIVTGSVRPGDAINENMLADQFNISRTPVREAVKKVSDEGLIRIVAQSGTYVAGIDQAQLEEAYVIRSTLELESVRRAALIITQAHVQAMRSIIAEHRLCLKQKRYADAIARDDEFHRSISEIVGMPMLWRVVEMSKAQMDRCRHLLVPGPGFGDRTIQEHDRILAALARHQPDEAAEAMRLHLRRTLTDGLDLLARRSDLLE